MKKSVTYHKSHTFTDSEGIKNTFQTELYSVGIYCIINNDPKQQLSLEPKNLFDIEKKLIELENEEKISDLVFGEEITVSDETGLWKEVKL